MSKYYDEDEGHYIIETELEPISKSYAENK